MAEKMKFFDVKSKEHFETDDYVIKIRKGRPFIVAKSKSGPHECWRVIGKEMREKLEKEGIKVVEDEKQAA